MTRPIDFTRDAEIQQRLDLFTEAIQQGIADADAGRVIDHKELTDIWDKRRATVIDCLGAGEINK